MKTSVEKQLVQIIPFQNQELDRYQEELKVNDGGYQRSSLGSKGQPSNVRVLPYALSEGGWLSIMLLFLVAILCCYTRLLLG